MGSVRFDYGGALALAATLWRLADDVEALATARERASTEASAEWEGSYGAQFDVASVDAVSRARAVATTLRADAGAWAQAWAKAMDDQNDITYQQEHDRVWRAVRGRARAEPLRRPVSDQPAAPAGSRRRPGGAFVLPDCRAGVVLMSVTSANPEHLADYLRTAGAGRVSVEDAVTAASGQESSVVAGCPGRAVTSSALGLLRTVLDDMGSTDSFVATVRDRLLLADTHNGIVEVSDEAIAAAMLTAGVTLPPFNPWASWIDIDELPIDQRVEINRRRIASDLATETDPERIKLLQGWLAEYVDPIDGTTTVPQVLLYEPALGQVAIAFGDVSNADYVAVAVPGTGTTMENYAIGDGGINRGESHRAIQLRMAMEQVAVGDAAVIAWLGYPAPSWSLSDHPGLSGPGEQGGPALASFVTGLPVAAGARRAVVGHSYGTYVVGEAIQAGMPVDNVISLGSPGMGVDHVSDLNLPDEADVHVMRLPHDPVGGVDRFGTDPASPAFGATRLDGTSSSLFSHSDYWTPPNLRQIAAAATDQQVDTTTYETFGEGVADIAKWPVRIEDDIIDGAQEHVLPDFVDGPIDGAQTVRRTVVGGVTTVAGTAVDGAIEVGGAVVDGAADLGEDIVDGVTGWLP